MSSGTFQHLRTLVTASIEDPTPDLRTDTVSALQSLMLAQAQESFFFKATLGLFLFFLWLKFKKKKKIVIGLEC